MNKTQIIRYLQSVVAIPLMAIAIPLTGINPTSVATDINNVSLEENSVITAQEEVIQKEKAIAIDKFFESINAPLAGYGMKFVTEAKKNSLDWRLLPAIAMRESTGGKFACKRVPNSVFGYGSCKLSFISIDESIEIVARSLGGNNPKTKHYYADKTTLQILNKYNSVIPNYSNQVIKIMKQIKDDGIIII